MESASHYKLPKCPLLPWWGRMNFTARQHPTILRAQQSSAWLALGLLWIKQANFNALFSVLVPPRCPARKCFDLVLFCCTCFDLVLFCCKFLCCSKSARKVCSAPMVVRRGVNGSPVVESIEQNWTSPSDADAVQAPWGHGAQRKCHQSPPVWDSRCKSVV